MKIWLLLLVFVVALPLTGSAACRKCRQQQNHYVLRSFHAGPNAPECDEDPDQGYIYVQDGRRCDDEGHWRCIRVDRCRDNYYQCQRQCCGRCPLYDDRDLECGFTDTTYDYPGRHVESWMNEASP